MGQCCDSTKNNLITPMNDIDLNSSRICDHYHMMISYSLSDRFLCHQLSTCLIKDGFHVWFESNPIENKFNRLIHKVIDNSDWIIVCVSDTYSQAYRCQKEARYASDMKKNILMVKVTDGYRMNDWLSFIKPGKIQFQLSKNKITFKTTYQKIRQELQRITKLHYSYSYRSLVASNTESTSLTTQKYRLQSSEILFYKLIERPWCFNTAIAEGSYAWTTIDSFIGLAIRTDEEMKRRYELDFDLSLMIKRRQQLSSYFNADSLDYFCIFAQRMRQNIIDWQKFCEK
ncbi:unnamed protein product [Adineta steineri]|uniref:TIR domain-containing protein n=1 Tax=Adineta steineri TaxID=433720 RepID=A0A815I5T1_9BILA|nr:unnamed protein product [Adineta steineri]CAF3730489.1 unnamed protein product [Adineta steineri]